MTAQETSYILCDTYESASQAADQLSACSAVIVDCEGRDLGMPGGALSLIAIGDATASQIFLLDALTLSDATHPLLAPLLTILRRPDVTKLMWDGRADFTEIAEAYGVRMEGVLDLQLVEVVQRGRRKRKGYRQEHTAYYFRDIKDELEGDPAALEGVHRLYGLERCAWEYKLIKKGEGKNHEVVAMHEQDRTEVWMQRPLPSALLEYSAHDIHIIAQLFARFQKKGHYLDDDEALKAMSARYMEAYPTRELRAKHAPLDLCKFVPLDVLAPPPDGMPKFECARCERMLSLRCFSTAARPDSKGNPDAAAPAGSEPEVTSQEDQTTVTQRFTLCRLCKLLARLNSETTLGEWVATTD
ncbi:ribonuclease H-like domain-containing protein [Cerioporus squamosus]|nr:ribonuclease H-like domain-containing protein [Cerioporus squamosus]